MLKTTSAIDLIASLEFRNEEQDNKEIQVKNQDKKELT